MASDPGTDPRVDAYIERSATFAQPVLRHLRAVVHSGGAEVGETIKWGMPFFTWRGKPLAHMAAFKAHCAFGFWNSVQVADPGLADRAMGQYGRITALADLPPKAELKALVKKAIGLIAAGVKPPRAPKSGTQKPSPVAPPDLVAALAGNAAAAGCWAAFAPSHRREYVEWIEEARRPETRARRLAQAVAWMAEGKSRNWKYAAC
jgi:uncharacterized protein YdeI (YjbR/CyaY-like superfamily)